MRAVDDHPQPVQLVRQGAEQVLGVPLGGVGQVPDPADAGPGRPGPALPIRASISSSTASASLCPPRAKSLIPLSGIGLWLAESTTPKSAPSSATRCAIAGVGSTPARSTSAPALVRPGEHGRLEHLPLARPSRPTTATGRWPPERSASTCAADDRHAQRQLGGQVGVAPPAHAVGAEQPSHAQPPSTGRAR